MKNVRRGDESFEEILEQLDRVQSALSQKEILLQIFESQKKAQGMGEILDLIIKVFIQPEINCIRCVVQSPRYLSNFFRFIGKNGKHADDFEYLDEQISELLRSKNPLIITDTAKIHSIKFNPGKPFPKAIVAWELSVNNRPFGIFWKGFDETIHVAQDEIVFYQDISEVMSLVLEKNISIFEKTVLNEIGFTSLDQVGFPLIIYIDQIMVFSNQQADLILNQWKSIHKSLDVSDDKTLAQFQKIEKMPDQFLKIGGIEYKVFISERKENQSGIYAIALVDRTRDTRHQQVSALIINTIGKNLRSAISHSLANLKMLSLIGELNNNQISYVHNTREALDEVMRVTEDLALIERFSNRRGLIIEDFLPSEVIQRVSKLFTQKTHQKRMEIKIVEASPQLIIASDQALFTQAIFHLLDYALERSRIGGIVTLEEQFHDDGWKFTIKDASRGMSQSELDGIFSQKDISEPNDGFHIANRIFKFLGGNLSVNNNFGIGCHFIVQIQNIGNNKPIL